MRRFRRNQQGNQISEFGPAIFILIIMMLIPMMVLVYVGLGFCCGWYLNYMSTRGAAVVRKADIPNALAAQQNAWYQSGLPKFTGATVLSNTAVRINNDADPEDDFVKCTTVVRIQPFVSIPMVPMGPFDFTYNGERPVEEYDLES